MICLVIWCCRVGVSVAMFVFVFMFVFFFMWASRLLFFFVFVWSSRFVFIFARSRSQMHEWVSWLPTPILVLLEGGAA